MVYIKKRAFDKDHYKRMIEDYLEEFKEATRHDIDELIMDKISDALDIDQKKNFITNLLQEMRRDGIIKSQGTTRWAKWALSKFSSERQN